jgi:hypothetical protein
LFEAWVIQNHFQEFLHVATRTFGIDFDLYGLYELFGIVLLHQLLRQTFFEMIQGVFTLVLLG